MFLIWGEGRGGVAKMFYPPLCDLEGRGHVLESKLGVDRTNMPPRGGRKVSEIRAPRLSGVHSGQGQGHHGAKPLSKLPMPGGGVGEGARVTSGKVCAQVTQTSPHGKTPSSGHNHNLSAAPAATSSSLPNPACSLGLCGKMQPCRQRTVLRGPRNQKTP